VSQSPPGVSPLRYLSAAAVDECLPPVEERIELAAEALGALGRGEAEMPPKLGVHPRPGALIHAMPAWLRTRDLVGLKWIAAFPDNRRHELPAINGLVVLNDAETGLPTWIIDAGRITAVRTAAVSGVALRLFAPSAARTVAILGGGVQAASHLEVVGALLPDARMLIYDRHPERAEGLATAANLRSGRDLARVAETARAATAEADIVITVATLTVDGQVMTASWLRDGGERLVVAVDFATYVAAGLANDADEFVVDDREQFLAYRDAGYFDGYPVPSATLGELLDGRAGASSANQLTLVTHLGVGLADVVIGAAIAAAAGERGIGQSLGG